MPLLISIECEINPVVRIKVGSIHANVSDSTTTAVNAEDRYAGSLIKRKRIFVSLCYDTMSVSSGDELISTKTTRFIFSFMIKALLLQSSYMITAVPFRVADFNRLSI